MTPTTPAEHAALPPLSDVVALVRGPEFDADEAAAFDAYTTGLTVRLWPWVGVMLALSAALWWPTDAIVFRDDPTVVAAFAAFRPRLILLDLTLAVVTPRVALLRRHAHLVATLAALSNVALGGWLLAEAGHGDPRWLLFANIMPIFSVMLLIPLPQRAAATGALAAGVLTAWLAHPDARPDAPGALATVSYMVFVCALSTFIGHLLFVQVRRSFHLTNRLERKRRALRDLADHLEEQVATQTAQVRALSDRARQIRSEQRREIARDLHDGLGQELTSLRLSVGIQRRLHGAARPDDAFADLEDQVALIQGSLRRILQSIRPHHLEDAALLEALANLTDEMERRSGLRCRFTAEDASMALPADVSVALFRIAQEALTNAVRHARARSVDVRLHGAPDAVTLTVHDDGHGFDPTRIGHGFGTHHITERATSLGGTATWTFDGGTRLRVVLPLGDAT